MENELSMEQNSQYQIKRGIRLQLQYIGENPNREGLLDTPHRVLKMWKEIFRGYDKEQKPKITVFNNGHDGINYDEMIFDSGNFYSICEHHLMPFYGQYYFAYVPDKKVLGLSKIARIVDYYSAKLQIQERLVREICNEITEKCEPKGLGLIMKAEHLCKTMRGTKKKGYMKTSDLRGVFKTNSDARSEFLKLIEI